MGLFDRKKTSFYTSEPYYTIGSNQTILVVGLGNPGAEYAKNRHNLGFMAVDYYQKNSHSFSNWQLKKDLQAMLCSAIIGQTKVILAKPTTFMNNSGDALQALQHFYKIDNSKTLVIHDELDIPFQTIRTRQGGGSAGHNGIKSITQNIGPEYQRIRVGIGPKPNPHLDSADFVLQDFNTQETEQIHKILREVASLIDQMTTGQLEEQTLKI